MVNGLLGGFATLVWAQYYAPSDIPWIPWILWLALVFFGALPGVVAYMVWAERKVAGRFQDRIGPNRVGPFGLLQPIADALKLLTKENIVPRSADQWVHLLAPVMILVSAFLVLAVVPFGVGYLDGRRFLGLVPVNPPAGLVYLLAVSSISALGIFLAGWSSRNKYSLLGAMRAVAQLISYEIPQVLATVPVVLWTGSLSLVAIMNQQFETGWFVFSPPGIMSFILLLIASTAEVNRTPFDLPEAESEIIAGYHTEYSGMRFGLFFLAEYLSVFGVSCLAALLFLGGGTLPFTRQPFEALGTSTGLAYFLSNAISVGLFSAKVLFFVFLMFWVRATLPRIRVDRLMNFAWKYMIPLAIYNIVLAAIWFEMVLRPSVKHTVVNVAFLSIDLTGVAAWALTGLLAIAGFWFVVRLNRVPRTDPEVVAEPKAMRREAVAAH